MNANESTTTQLSACAAPACTVPDAFIEALEAGQEITAAAHAVQTCTLSPAAVVALPDTMKLHDLECYMEVRRRMRGTMSTCFVKPFAQYVQTHADTGATIFVNPDQMTAVAVLDLGTPDRPGHTDNRAKLEPVKTAAYAALMSMANGAHGQKEVAEFLEDWADHLTCLNADGTVPLPLALAAVRKITVESAQKVHSEEQSLSSSRSAFESIKASSTDPLPTTLHFTCHPYADLAARTFSLRLSVLTSDAKPKLTLRIQKAEEHKEQMANELVDLITQSMDSTPMPVLVGSYQKAA